MGSVRNHSTTEPPEYLGALLDGKQRLVLIEVDPKKPWEAVRRMRAFMRLTRASHGKAAEIDVYAPGTDLRNEAKVIPLHPPRT